MTNDFLYKQAGEILARYVVMEGSQTGHCCFEASVVDTSINTNPNIGPNDPVYNKIVCECNDVEDAITICEALNAAVKT